MVLLGFFQIKFFFYLEFYILKILGTLEYTLYRPVPTSLHYERLRATLIEQLSRQGATID